MGSPEDDDDDDDDEAAAAAEAGDEAVGLGAQRGLASHLVRADLLVEDLAHGRVLDGFVDALVEPGHVEEAGHVVVLGRRRRLVAARRRPRHEIERHCS